MNRWLWKRIRAFLFKNNLYRADVYKRWSRLKIREFQRVLIDDLYCGCPILDMARNKSGRK